MVEMLAAPWCAKSATIKDRLKAQRRLVRDCAYEAWCAQHHGLEVAWVQAADRLDGLAEARGKNGIDRGFTDAAPDLCAANAEVVKARDAMLAAGCPGHSGHEYSPEIRAMMRTCVFLGAAGQGSAASLQLD